MRLLRSLRTMREHLPEYLIEAFCLGLFMISAVGFSVLLFAKGSVGAERIDSDFVRRFLMGLAMGGTAVALISSPWGKRSGAHLNPAVTLTFLRLRKIQPIDALGYTLFQVLGAIGGVALCRALLGNGASEPPVEFAVTRPGMFGIVVAFVGEFGISFLLMAVVLYASNHSALNRFTAWIAGALVCAYITFEAPLSGMSMNPARSLGSALVAGRFEDLWIYFVAPPLGMLLAAEAMIHVFGRGAVLCAKLRHDGTQRCIFLCRFDPRALIGSAD